MKIHQKAISRTVGVILAGGRGERLLPLTAARPKPAVPFGGVFRIIDFTLSNCLNSDVRQLCVLTQHKYEVLHRYVRDGWGALWNEFQWDSGEQLVCLPPCGGKRYQGTADAVFQNLTVINETRREFVLVLAGDHVYRMNYDDMVQQHADSGADLTMAVVQYPIEDASRFGVTEVDENFRVTSFNEKPSRPCPIPSRPSHALISMGVYVFRADVLARILIEAAQLNNGKDFGTDIIPMLLSYGRVNAFDFRDVHRAKPGYWRDIGTIDSYYDASMDLVRPLPPINPYSSTDWPIRGWAQGFNTAVGRWHGPGRKVVESVISPDVYLDDRVHIECSSLMSGVHVGAGARLRNAIIEENTKIPAGCRIGYDLQEDRKRFAVTESGIIVVSDCVSQNLVARSNDLSTRRMLLPDTVSSASGASARLTIYSGSG